MGSNLALQALRICLERKKLDMLISLDCTDDDAHPLDKLLEGDSDHRASDLIPADEEVGLSQPVAGGNSHTEVRELATDGLEERVLEILFASDRHDFREAFLHANALHTSIVRALTANPDQAADRAAPKRLGGLGEILTSFRRWVVQGIDNKFIPLVVAQLNIIIHVMEKLLPEDGGAVRGDEQNLAPQSIASPQVNNHEAVAELGHDESTVPINSIPDQRSETTTFPTRDDHRVIHLNPDAPVELDAGFDGSIATPSSE